MLHNVRAVANIATDAAGLGQVGYGKGQVIAFIATIVSKINELHFAASHFGNLLAAPARAATEVHNDIRQLGISRLDEMWRK